MTRWFSKRWAWAAVVGAAVVVAAAPAADNPPQKVGATISLNIDGKGERQFKVVKVEKQPNGSYHSELKDTKSGETITLVDEPDAAPAKPVDPPKAGPAPKLPEPPKVPEPPKGGDAPKAKPRTSDPLTPPVAAVPDMNKDKDKRPVLGRVFGDKDKPTPPPAPAMTAPAMAAPAPAAEKKPGLFSRVFGKKPSGPNMSVPTAPTNASSAPPPVIPTPQGGLTGGTAEPPRVMPARPAVPPQPPVAAPSVPAPVPAPLPSFPAPLPPGGGGLPPIPVPPGGTSSAQPIQVVVPAGFVPAAVAFERDVEPFVHALRAMDAPSARLTAARALAQGRHGSTDAVKGVLFEAAQKDPCGEVRAACITHLCQLGYFDPRFLGHIQASCGDPDPQVSAAAKAACAKMLPKP